MLWGALNNASSAMMAMSVDMGSIGQNIANVNTTGYKRSQMLFKTVMSESHASPNSYVSGLNIFGVQATQRNLIEAQGIVTPSTTWSDLAINGRGMFMVAPGVGGGVPSSVDTTNQKSVLYTRDGSWHRTYGPDTDPNLARNYFVTGGGNYLLGYMADDTGNIPSGATLQPVYTLAPRPIANNGTSAVDEASTLKPTSQTMPGRATTTASILANLPGNSALTGNSYSTTVQVTDPAGNAQTLSMDWARDAANPNQWNVTYSIPNATVTSGTLAVTSGVMTVTMNSLGKMVATPANPAADPNTDSSVPANIVIDWDDATYGAAAASTTQAVSTSGPQLKTEKIPIPIYDQNFYGHTVNLNFERTGVNTWLMHVMGDGNATGTDLTATAPIELQFDGNGKLVSPANGVDLALSWTGTNAGSANISLDMDKLSQYTDQSAYIGTVKQDGYARGTLMATTFNEMGELRGYYDNGQSRTLFKVPVATFTSENNLNPISGTLFQRTAAAGDMTIGGIDEVPGEGRFATSSLETSTVSIEDEFTRMIMTQKAYSTNAQVFKTADEMTSLARDLKR